MGKECYSRSIEINPIRFGPIYKNLGVVLLNLGIDGDARDSFREYLKHVPDAADKENIMQFLNS